MKKSFFLIISIITIISITGCKKEVTPQCDTCIQEKPEIKIEKQVKKIEVSEKDKETKIINYANRCTKCEFPVIIRKK